MPVAVILLILVLLAALITVLMFLFVFYSPNRSQNDDHNIAHTPQMDPLHDTIDAMIDTLNAIPYERVHIRSKDGLMLLGRLYRSNDHAPIVIGFHGYRGTPSRDFSGGTQMYLSAGFNLLLIEERAHGTSGGHVITFGVKERYDCLEWIEYVRQRFGSDAPILLAGISMGAATVLMASGLDLPDNVKGIVADAPYTSPKAIIQKVCRDWKIPVFAAYPFLSLGAHLFGGFGLKDADASEAVKNAKVPILLIHGEDDRFVPCDMGREIAAANPAMIELHTFPDAGHGLSFLVDRERYESTVNAFFARTISVAAN